MKQKNKSSLISKLHKQYKIITFVVLCVTLYAINENDFFYIVCFFFDAGKRDDEYFLFSYAKSSYISDYNDYSNDVY